jgi:hypothetical protein
MAATAANRTKVRFLRFRASENETIDRIANALGAVSADRLYGFERFILQRARRGPYVERSALVEAWAYDDSAASARPSV